MKKQQNNRQDWEKACGPHILYFNT